MPTAKLIVRMSVLAIAVLGLAMCVQDSPTSPTSPLSAGPELTSPSSTGMPTPASQLGAGRNKVTICHIPPGNPDNAHEITVGEPAVAAHLAHGDDLDECREDPPGCEAECSLLSEDCCLARADCGLFYNEYEEVWCKAIDAN
jgi:hypothetical protein